MAAALFIGSLSAMIAPHWIAQIQGAWIGSCADHSATGGANGCAGRNISCGCAHKRACACANQAARHRAVTRIGAAASQDQHRSRRNRDGQISHTHHFLLICARTSK
jgi:hypothetical protein